MRANAAKGGISKAGKLLVSHDRLLCYFVSSVFVYYYVEYPVHRILAWTSANTGPQCVCFVILQLIIYIKRQVIVDLRIAPLFVPSRNDSPDVYAVSDEADKIFFFPFCNTE